MIATTLRVTFTGAAPLLDTIRLDYGLSTAQTGLLTTLPLLAFALVSPLAAGVARRIGMERSLFIALLLICSDCRSLAAFRRFAFHRNGDRRLRYCARERAVTRID